MGPASHEPAEVVHVCACISICVYTYIYIYICRYVYRYVCMIVILKGSRLPPELNLWSLIAELALNPKPY